MKSVRSLIMMFAVAGLVSCTASVVFAAPKKSAAASIFREKCSMCHGIEGKGFAAIKTPDFTDPKWQAAHPDKELLDAMENGVPGTAMVSFKGKLTEQQMKNMLHYIRSLAAKNKKKK